MGIDEKGGIYPWKQYSSRVPLFWKWILYRSAGWSEGKQIGIRPLFHKQYIPGSVLNDGTLCTGSEYVIKDCLQTLYPGERVRFRGQFLAVAEKESRLEGGLLKNTYILRREDAFQAARIYNYQQIGASIVGTVTESSSDKSRLSLSTDGDGESADSWHSRPIFYSGGGAGYSGRPEVGDTMYLYFPVKMKNLVRLSPEAGQVIKHSIALPSRL